MLSHLVLKYAMRRGVIPRLKKTKFLGKDGEFYREAVTVRHLAESILESYQGCTWIIFDTETAGLPEALPEAQVTEIAAYAVRFGRFETTPIEGLDGKTYNEKTLKPEYLGSFHRQINLTEESISKLDQGLKGAKVPTVRQLLHYNNYNFHEFERATGKKLPPAPEGFKPLVKFKPDELHEETGPKIELHPGEEVLGSFDEKDVFHDFLSWISMIKGKSERTLMVAHNASFDWKFVMTRCGMLKLPTSTLKSLETFDSLTFMRVFIQPIGEIVKHDEFFKRLKEESKNKNGVFSTFSFALDKVTKSFGVLDPAKSHTAFKDVENTVKVLAKLIVILKHLGEYTPGDLDSPPEGEIAHPEETEQLKATDVTDSLRAAVIKMESYKQADRTRRFNREVKKNKERQTKYLQRKRDIIDTERDERQKRRTEKP